MTAPENVVLRWARLKRNADIQRGAEPAADPLPAAGASAGDAEATTAQSRIDAAAGEPFDAASLPSIDSISASTDISGFLQNRVPVELTRAALRQAWASDPAIRDFIGIAENQWDFNDPNAIPGFGPLLETDNMPALLAQALGGDDRLAEMVLPEMPAAVEPSLAGKDGQPTDPHPGVEPTFDGPASTDIGGCGLAGRDIADCAAAGNDPIAEGDGIASNCRSHGSALPR
jgi:hypothetical protein